jgi:alpha-glucosidase
MGRESDLRREPPLGKTAHAPFSRMLQLEAQSPNLAPRLCDPTHSSNRYQTKRAIMMTPLAPSKPKRRRSSVRPLPPNGHLDMESSYGMPESDQQPVDSRDSSYRYVRVDEFNPNSADGWISFGNVTECVYDQADGIFTITGTPPDGTTQPIVSGGAAVSTAAATAPTLKIYVLGPSAFRVRFNPTGDYSMDGSFAVVNKDLGKAQIHILQNDDQKLSVDLGTIRLDVLFQPFTLQVYLSDHLISTDTAQGLIYVSEGGEAVANFKNYPANAHYFGAGEKGGSDLTLNEAALTFFNYDNYKYSGSNQDNQPYPFLSVIPDTTDPNPVLQAGPLNWTEPLYNSIPFFIEDNPNPLTSEGAPTGVPYAYGILLDNESQTYMNFGASSSFNGNMYGKYFFGALYGEIDYYFLAGENAQEVLKQYSTLVGAAALAPMWALGNHQGCYGYYDQGKVISAIQQYRAAEIPLDGMHIDVDFQNNYRTFTASNLKFPGGGHACFAAAAQLGVKCSTNITGIVTTQPLDENGNATPYSVLEEGKELGVFVQDDRAEGPGPAYPDPYVTNESYGVNYGSNPYPSPGAGTENGGVALGTYGYYADLGQLPVREWWGRQYKPLLDAGLEMVWQDMTDPATQPSVSDSAPYKTLALNVLMFDYTQNKMVPSAQIHNVFALNLISATHTGLVKLREEARVDKRPFIIARGGFTGVHRYAASWTGDSASDWNFLSILIPEVLNFGLSGQPMAGADVGGFATSSAGGYANGTLSPTTVDPATHTVYGGITDPELLARWTTISAFIGWCRNHYDGYNKQYQEPYAYGGLCQAACQKYIQIRYKLLQLFYDLLYQCTQTGLPICRPLFLTDRNDLNVYTHLNDQFMVGNDLLIAPIVQHGSVNRDVYLPAGSDWFAYQDAQAPLPAANPGGQSFNWYAPLDIVPIYVRAGAILVRRELEQYVGQLPQCPLTFECYPGSDRDYTLYLDDKVGFGYQKGSYRLTQIAQHCTTGTPQSRTVSVTRTYDQYSPKETFFYISLLQATHASSVTLGGTVVPDLTGGGDAQSAAALAASASDAFYFSTSLQTVFIKIFDDAPSLEVTATF